MNRVEKELRFLCEASSQLAESLDYQGTLFRVSQLATSFISDGCFIDEIDGKGNLSRIASAHRERGREESLDGKRFREHPLPGEVRIQDALWEGRSLRFSLGEEACMIVPLRARGQTFAAMTLFSRGPCFDEESLALAEELGRRAAQAADNARLYEEARKAIKVRENIMAMVSHDLKNPVTVIAMSAGLIARRLPEGDELKEIRNLVDNIRYSADRMNHLIRDVLDLAMIEENRFCVRTAPQDPRALIQNIIMALAPLAAERGIRLESEIPDGLPCALCDRERIMQVLSNLVGNAFRFTPRKGLVSVRVNAEDSQLLFEVRDTGQGIRPEHFPHLFERFWRADGQSSNGTGLGLAISKGIVEAHGGRIWARSEPGSGASFLFTLPASQAGRPAWMTGTLAVSRSP